eukprot:418209-Pyramimonas_sp.AAC.1
MSWRDWTAILTSCASLRRCLRQCFPVSRSSSFVGERRAPGCPPACPELARVGHPRPWRRELPGKCGPLQQVL